MNKTLKIIPLISSDYSTPFNKKITKNEIILKEKINGKCKTILIPLIGDNKEDIIDSINKVF